jgi:hypothetical protein
MSVRPRPTQSEFFEDSSLLRPSVEAPAIRLVDLRNEQFPSWRHSLGNLDPLGSLGRLEPLAYARYLIAFSIGLAVALAWQSYGGATREAAVLKAISLDRDAVRQSIDRIATSVAASQDEMRRSIERSIDRIAAGQAQAEREISDMQTVEQYLLDRISTFPPRPAPTTASKPVPRSPQVPIQVAPPTSP